MGVLDGVRVVELGGLGPSAWACTFLSDMGADVVRLDRPGRDDIDFTDTWMRGRSQLRVDLKAREGRRQARDLLARADVVLESFRPGVAERLRLGPDDVRPTNPGLVYARLTGYGQDGPYAQLAGHALNYLAISGVLDTIGTPTSGPIPPLYYVGDWANGTMLVLAGILGALFERSRSGEGQVVDASIIDGAGLMLMQVMDLRRSGRWRDSRGQNGIDGGAWYYATYATSDDRAMAVGAFEPIFRERVLRTLGLPVDEPRVHDPRRWSDVREEVASTIAGRSQAEWETVFAGVDACVTPVRSLQEALEEPHLVARESYVDLDGRRQAAPAPRFGRTPSSPAASTVPFDPGSWALD